MACLLYIIHTDIIISKVYFNSKCVLLNEVAANINHFRTLQSSHASTLWLTNVSIWMHSSSSISRKKTLPLLVCVCVYGVNCKHKWSIDTCRHSTDRKHTRLMWFSALKNANWSRGVYRVTQLSSIVSRNELQNLCLHSGFTLNMTTVRLKKPTISSAEFFLSKLAITPPQYARFSHRCIIYQVYFDKRRVAMNIQINLSTDARIFTRFNGHINNQ